MKVLFVLHHLDAFRFYDGVARCLAAERHEVKVLVGTMGAGDLGRLARPLVDCRDRAGVLFGLASGRERRDWWYWVLGVSRELLSYGIYLTPRHPSPALADRWATLLPQPVRLMATSRPGRKFFASPLVQRGLRFVERLAPPSRHVMRELTQERPDVLVASPAIVGRRGLTSDVEWMKAAKALGIPTVASVLSWDNLTTKGTFHVLPDRVFVWNDALANEAVQIHGVPRERVQVVGAPVFDFWFETRPSVTRMEFCRGVGLDPSRPFVAYVASSLGTAASDEASFVRQFLEALRDLPETREVGFLVRPHPWHSSVWANFSAPNVVVWPPGGDIPNAPEPRRDYFHTLHFAVAVAGVNTSAMVEAAIADKPCITIMTERYRETQEGRGHFHHLLRADFLEVAGGFQEAAAITARVLAGEDRRAEQRRRFVRDFIRPCSLEEPAAAVMGRAICALATQPGPFPVSGGPTPTIRL